MSHLLFAVLCGLELGLPPGGARLRPRAVCVSRSEPVVRRRGHASRCEPCPGAAVGRVLPRLLRRDHDPPRDARVPRCRGRPARAFAEKWADVSFLIFFPFGFLLFPFTDYS